MSKTINTPENRPDRYGEHRVAFERNKKKILATQNTCGICGKPVDFALKFPHPMSPAIDHIIPVVHQGHPSDISNLQLAHLACNRAKADKLMKDPAAPAQSVISNRILPQSLDWASYKG